MRDVYADRIVRLERVVAAMLENELDGGGGSEFYHPEDSFERAAKEGDKNPGRADLYAILEDMRADIVRHDSTGQI